MRRQRLLTLYVGLVCVLAASAATAAVHHAPPVTPFPFVPASVLAVLVILGDLYPLFVHLRSGRAALCTSTSFAFALLLMAGPGPALGVYGAASLLADVRSGLPFTKVAFNVAQYVLALALGGFVVVFTDVWRSGTSLAFQVEDILPLLGAIGAILVTNHLLTGVAIALSQQASVLEILRDWAGKSLLPGALLLLSPAIALIATHGLVLIPTLCLIVGLLYFDTRRSLEQEHAALHDPLTGLANRRLFTRTLEEALAERNEEQLLATALIDLDKFKPINDTLGHHVGDVVLQQVGPRLQESVPEIDLLARLGGDEFAVILRPVDDIGRVEEVAARLAAAFSEAFAVEGYPLELGASIGVALAPIDGETVETLLERADIAMYAAKREGIGWRRFQTERDASGRGHLELLADLRTALETDDQLFLHWQPIAQVRDDAVDAVEALVRWQHPRYGLIHPDEFIPLAEKTDLINPLTKLVVAQALHQCRDWHDQGLPLRVAVNLSIHNLRDTSFPLFVQRQLTEHGVEGRWLKLEITEHTLLQDPDRVQRTLLELRALGIGIAIDDFGTGYSSLVHLRYLPIDEIKIDRTFVQAMGADDALVPSIIQFARSLGLQIVAEGVETGDALQRLGLHGCDLAQGFYLARPAAADDTTVWLRDLSTTGAPWRLPLTTAEPEDVLGGLGDPDRDLHDIVPLLIDRKA